VTFQLVVFGSFRYEHTNYYADNEIGFKHLFLKVGGFVRAQFFCPGGEFFSGREFFVLAPIFFIPDPILRSPFTSPAPIAYCD
jgi:hypothetical protein